MAITVHTKPIADQPQQGGGIGQGDVLSYLMRREELAAAKKERAQGLQLETTKALLEYSDRLTGITPATKRDALDLQEINQNFNDVFEELISKPPEDMTSINETIIKASGIARDPRLTRIRSNAATELKIGERQRTLGEEGRYFAGIDPSVDEKSRIDTVGLTPEGDVNPEASEMDLYLRNVSIPEYEPDVTGVVMTKVKGAVDKVKTVGDSTLLDTVSQQAYRLNEEGRPTEAVKVIVTNSLAPYRHQIDAEFEAAEKLSGKYTTPEEWREAKKENYENYINQLVIASSPVGTSITKMGKLDTAEQNKPGGGGDTEIIPLRPVTGPSYIGGKNVSVEELDEAVDTAEDKISSANVKIKDENLPDLAREEAERELKTAENELAAAETKQAEYEVLGNEKGLIKPVLPDFPGEISVKVDEDEVIKIGPEEIKRAIKKVVRESAGPSMFKKIIKETYEQDPALDFGFLGPFTPKGPPEKAIKKDPALNFGFLGPLTVQEAKRGDSFRRALSKELNIAEGSNPEFDAYLDGVINFYGDTLPTYRGKLNEEVGKNPKVDTVYYPVDYTAGNRKERDETDKSVADLNQNLNNTLRSSVIVKNVELVEQGDEGKVIDPDVNGTYEYVSIASPNPLLPPHVLVRYTRPATSGDKNPAPEVLILRPKDTSSDAAIMEVIGGLSEAMGRPDIYRKHELKHLPTIAGVSAKLDLNSAYKESSNLIKPITDQFNRVDVLALGNEQYNIALTDKEGQTSPLSIADKYWANPSVDVLYQLIPLLDVPEEEEAEAFEAVKLHFQGVFNTPEQYKALFKKALPERVEELMTTRGAQYPTALEDLYYTTPYVFSGVDLAVDSVPLVAFAKSEHKDLVNARDIEGGKITVAYRPNKSIKNLARPMIHKDIVKYLKPGYIEGVEMPSMVITESYRDPSLKVEGGSATTLHRQGKAIDIPTTEDWTPIIAYFKALKASGVNLEIIDEGDHLHIEFNI